MAEKACLLTVQVVYDDKETDAHSMATALDKILDCVMGDRNQDGFATLQGHGSPKVSKFLVASDGMNPAELTS